MAVGERARTWIGLHRHLTVPARWDSVTDLAEGGVVDDSVSPDGILQLGLGFWASKVLLTAVELGLFTLLAERQPRSGPELTEDLGLQPRGSMDFLDALVSLGMLERDDGVYRNAPATELFLDRKKPSYVGGILEMANARLYTFWGHLTEALRTGEPQNEAKAGENFFTALYQEPARLEQFLKAMTGLTLGAATAMTEKFPWHQYSTVVDVGAAEGCLPVQLALRHPHLSGGGFDLPPVRPVFESYVAANGLSDRLRFYPGDFFTDPLPQADVLIMGHILHDWSLDEKLQLLRKAHDALPEGGALIVYEAIIDDDRRKNTFGLLMSINMLIETPAGFDYTASDCQEWMSEVGFTKTLAEPLIGPDAMVIAIK